MIDVLVMIEVVKWLARDLHYKFQGPTFYANHLLADRVKDFGSADDDLKEGYWLGCLDTTPPDDKDIAELATTTYNEIINAKPCLLTKLLEGLDRLDNSVGEAKKDASLNGGVHAILDDISKRVNTYRFLVRAQSRVVEAPSA